MVRDVGTVGVLRDGYREVEKGVEPGDWVVVAGMQRLRPGLEVKSEKFDERTTAEKKAAAASKPAAVSKPAETSAIEKINVTESGSGAGKSSPSPTSPATRIRPSAPVGTKPSSRQGPRAGR